MSMFKKKVYLAEEIEWNPTTRKVTTRKVYGVFKKRKDADLCLTSRGFCLGATVNVVDDLGIRRILLARRHWTDIERLARVTERDVK